MAKKNDKMSRREAYGLNLRGFRIMMKVAPGFFIVNAAYSIVKALSPYVTIYFSAQVINELAGARDMDALRKWVLLTLICTAVCALLNGILQRLSNIKQGLLFYKENRIYMDKMLDLDFAEVDDRHVHDIYTQVMQTRNWSLLGLSKLQFYYDELLTGFFQMLGGIGLSVSLFTSRIPEGGRLLFLNSPIYAALILAAMLLIAVLSPMCTNRGNSYWANSSESARFGNRAFTFFGSSLYMERERALDARMYRQHENVYSPYLKRCTSFTTKGEYAKFCRGPMGLWRALGQCVSMVLTGVIYLFVCLKSWAGAFGVGSITQYVGATTQLFLGLAGLLKVLGDIRLNGEFLKTTFEFLDTPNKMYQGTLSTEKRSDRDYDVEFHDVSFKYPGTDTWALRHVNLRFKISSRLAVVGRNGSGKTTFIKLLCRLYDPTEGEITLNGIDIRKYDYKQYMDLFSVVFQDFKLLPLPLGQNIAGSTEYDKDRVMKCLADAGFEDRLDGMPAGLDTYLYKNIDEDGVDVSGGEAQKIAIARALYSNSPFIILDEPTAALDPIAEAEIYSRFNDIITDKTAVYISHRLSSCKFCDEIAVFDSGEIVQHGTHNSLLADEQGLYHELWNAQAQYYTK